MTRTHTHKNPFLLNFVFCFILLFSLNTSLKSVCTSDVDMGGYWLLNVDTITFYTPPPEPLLAAVDPLIVADVKYVNPLVSKGNFASTTATVITDCAASDGEFYYLILSTQRDLACPDGSALIEFGSAIFPTLTQILESMPFVANWSNTCVSEAKGMLLVSNPNTLNTHVLFQATSIGLRTEQAGDPRYSVPLCRLDDQS